MKEHISIVHYTPTRTGKHLTDGLASGLERILSCSGIWTSDLWVMSPDAHTHTHTHTRTCIHAHTHAHTCIHARTHAYTHTHTHTHTHAHTGCIVHTDSIMTVREDTLYMHIHV